MVSITLDPVEDLPVRCLALIFEWRKVEWAIAAVDVTVQKAIDSVSVRRVGEAPPSMDA